MCRTPHREDTLVQEAEGRSKAWYHGVWIVVSLEGAGGDASTGWVGRSGTCGQCALEWGGRCQGARALPSVSLSAQPGAQNLVHQRLGGAGRAPLVLHALHARQAGVGLLHYRDLAGL